jgi:hypothetical protein
MDREDSAGSVRVVQRTLPVSLRSETLMVSACKVFRRSIRLGISVPSNSEKRRWRQKESQNLYSRTIPAPFALVILRLPRRLPHRIQRDTRKRLRPGHEKWFGRNPVS